MKEILRSNNPVMLSFAQALLSEAKIETVLLDLHASIMDGSVLAVRRRLMVDDEDYEPARRILIEAELDPK